MAVLRSCVWQRQRETEPQDGQECPSSSVGLRYHETDARDYAVAVTIGSTLKIEMLSATMTQAQILTEFQRLTTPQQLELLQAALDVVRKSFSQSQANSHTAPQTSLSDAAQRLLADYETDAELTCFTSLDGEPIHAAR